MKGWFGRDEKVKSIDWEIALVLPALVWYIKYRNFMNKEDLLMEYLSDNISAAKMVRKLSA